jgi:excisionase family DNA binding protein
MLGRRSATSAHLVGERDLVAQELPCVGRETGTGRMVLDESQTMRVTVEEAAQLLGIEKLSVKKRIQRGKLRSERDGGGTTYVYVDTSETVRDGSEDGPGAVREELVDELRNRVAYLERQIEEAREARRRADTILAQLSQANAE